MSPEPARMLFSSGTRGSWGEFVQQHVATVWATDFSSKKVWTTKGLVDVFVLFLIHVDSRRVYLSGAPA
jgi:hypothetical protein